MIFFQEGKTLLHWASLRGNFEMCKILLKKLAEIDREDSKGLRPLDYACRNGDLETIKFLIRNGSYPFIKRWRKSFKKDIQDLIRQVKWVNIFYYFFYFFRFGLCLLG